MEHPLRSYRLKHSLTLDDLAKRIDSSKAALSRIERRRALPSLDLVARIIRATGGALRADDFLPRDFATSEETVA